MIILDEIDSVGIKSFSKHDSRNEETNGILNMIDKIEREKLDIIVIGITNYPEKLEPALVRSGRLSNKIEFSFPTEEELGIMVDYLRQISEKSYKSDRVRWSERFWQEVKEITVELAKEKVSLVLVDLQQIIGLTLAQACQENSSTIKPRSEDYRIILEKEVQEKTRKNKANEQISKLFKSFVSSVPLSERTPDN